MRRKLRVVSLVGLFALGFGGLAVAQAVPKITGKQIRPKGRELQGKPKNLQLIATLPLLTRLSGAAHGVFDVGSTLNVTGRNLPARGALVMRVASLSGTFADLSVLRWSTTEVLGSFDAAQRSALFGGSSAAELDAVVGLYDPRARAWVSNTLRLRVRAQRPRATPSTPDADGDGAIASELGGFDCDDTDPKRFPGQTEICDDRDDDCDPVTVGDRDADGDGFVDCACTNEGRTATFCDCDDRRADVHYGNPETCDGVDNDCDGSVDEGVGILMYVDGDGDGYGTGAARQRSCELRPGVSVFGNDCDDRDAKKTPLSGCP